MADTVSSPQKVGLAYDQFIIFGDSITQQSYNQGMGFGWGAQLQEVYSRKLDIINRGFSGYTTANAIKILDQFFPSPQTANVRLMTIFFGANDSVGKDHFQHVSIEVYKENLKKIIQHPAVQAQNPYIILMTPPPVNEYQLEQFDAEKSTPHPSRTAKNTKDYADVTRVIGKELNLPVADIWSAFMDVTGWKEGLPLPGSRDLPEIESLSALFVDGLHPSPGGSKIIFNEVLTTIEKSLPDFAPMALPMIFPPFPEAPK
ncbi:Esterase SGNH hydrolase-type subgroup [Penicillium argentinense]|uniref:Esterase SGNH hydrolase-type subgroup n=1 Tax=Penicillium argentinense TaxID=1131581 RepID=A0A9W9KEW2_9EURO|nr:Esterase SGNH hydrolase-type subgroup [Penicillium argentinense]KAJ5103138.1 Esterase SGNH hydrolase-type subgroup [Penicillium argentinense]